MGSLKIKICGLKRKKDVQLCMKLGVDILGFVTEYPLPVPWNMSRHEALPLLNMVHSPHKTCIVTGGAIDKVIELATDLRPNLVQLHYKETLEETVIISDALRKLNIGVIKTVPPAMEDRILQFGTADIKIIIKELCKTGVFGLLADSRVPTNAAAKGTELDFKFCSQILHLSTKPVIIAGGINADNICNIIKQTGADFIDVMTGVERSPGEKDVELLSGLSTTIQLLKNQ